MKRRDDNRPLSNELEDIILYKMWQAIVALEPGRSLVGVGRELCVKATDNLCYGTVPPRSILEGLRLED